MLIWAKKWIIVWHENFIFFLIIRMNNKNTCYGQTEEHLKEYAQRCYHLVNYKVKATEYYKKSNK